MNDIKRRRVDSDAAPPVVTDKLRNYLLECESTMLSEEFFGFSDEERMRLARQIEVLTPFRATDAPVFLDRTVAWRIFSRTEEPRLLLFFFIARSIVFREKAGGRQSDFGSLIARLYLGSDDSKRILFYSYAAVLVLSRVALSDDIEQALRAALVERDEYIAYYELTFFFDDPTRGTVQYFSPFTMADITKAVTLAFASDADRASLCSVDRYTWTLCTRARNKIAEYQFFYMFRSEVTLNALRERREVFFGGVGTASEWAAYYRACVAAVTFVQTNSALSIYAIQDKFIEQFGFTRSRERAALLPPEARPDGPTPDDRRFRTARMVLWWLYFTKEFERANALFRTALHRGVVVSELVNTDGTVYDGTPIADKLLVVATDLHDLAGLLQKVSFTDEFIEYLYQRIDDKALWIEVLIGIAAPTRIALAPLLVQRTDLTNLDELAISVEVAPKLALLFRKDPDKLIDFATRHGSLWLLWSRFFTQMIYALSDVSTHNVRRLLRVVLDLEARNAALIDAQTQVELNALYKRIIERLLFDPTVAAADVVAAYTMKPDRALWSAVVADDTGVTEGMRDKVLALLDAVPSDDIVLRSRINEFLWRQLRFGK